MSIDYSQFYRGTSSIQSYGNSAYKKDTLVKYEFNTTDEKGNKVMDKMTREETLQAMNDIRSQYGNNVIVEFSGDGMAALVENRKGLVDEAITDEQRAAKAERDAAFANEIKQNEHSSIATALKAADSQPKLSSRAQKLLDELSAKYNNVNFLVGDSDNVKELMKNSGKEYSVLLTAEDLEKMASDDSYKNEVLNKTARLMDFSNRINEKYGFTVTGSIIAGGISSRYGLASNHDGTLSLFAELTNMAKEKKSLLLASSENELLNKLEKFDWSQVALANKIVFKED